MKFHIEPSQLRGSIQIPSSKSHTLRAILFALMGKGKSVIHDFLPSPDSQAMIKAITQLGAKVTQFDQSLHIEGVAGCLSCPATAIDAGNSGIVLRFAGAISALSSHLITITGDHSLQHNRPVLPLLAGLKDLGAYVESKNGHAPITIQGPIKPGIARLSGEDSQPVSGLLIAASFLQGSSNIYVTNPGEKPWIDLTLFWLKKIGIEVQNNSYEHYFVPGGASYDRFEIRIPGDFSTAAFPIGAALITGSTLELTNLDVNDVQGDKKVIEILRNMGAAVEIDSTNHKVFVKNGGKLIGQKIDINDCIDAIGILSVIGCFAEGTTEIVGAAIARKKECDRIHAIATELKKMGAKIEEREDGLLIHQSPLKGATLETYNDHRMVLSLSVAALGAQGPSVIHGIESVKKTYPDFKRDFQKIGGKIV